MTCTGNSGLEGTTGLPPRGPWVPGPRSRCPGVETARGSVVCRPSSSAVPAASGGDFSVVATWPQPAASSPLSGPSRCHRCRRV